MRGQLTRYKVGAPLDKLIGEGPYSLWSAKIAIFSWFESQELIDRRTGRLSAVNARTGKTNKIVKNILSDVSKHFFTKEIDSLSMFHLYMIMRLYLKDVTK